MSTLGEGGARVKVVVAGQGYVGLPLAMRAVALGHDVTGFDVNGERVNLINQGKSFTGDVSNAEVKSALSSRHYRATCDEDDCAAFDVAVITVPTPLREGIPDLSLIEESVTMLTRYLTKGSTVILESTTYPGTTDEIVVPILEGGSGLTAGSDFYVGFSPERIDPGNSVWSFKNTPKIVSGINGPSLDKVNEFYSALVDRTVPVSSTRVAELTKLLENTFRHVNIALVNELAMFANELNVDIWEAIDGASSKPFGFMPFTPGPGVGGHCLPIDPSYLSWRVQRVTGKAFRFVELANDVNSHMPSYVVGRITSLLNREKKSVNGSRILVLGLAYKKNTSDMRESPSLAICEALSNLGADVRVVDAKVPTSVTVPWHRAELTDEELQEADITVIITDHDGVDYDRVALKAKLVFDTRRRTVAGATVEQI